MRIENQIKISFLRRLEFMPRNLDQNFCSRIPSLYSDNKFYNSICIDVSCLSFLYIVKAMRDSVGEGVDVVLAVELFSLCHPSSLPSLPPREFLYMSSLSSSIKGTAPQECTNNSEFNFFIVWPLCDPYILVSL
jgi:hypothetical protein